MGAVGKFGGSHIDKRLVPVKNESVSSRWRAMSMKRSAAIAILAMLISCPVVADEQSAATSREPYAPSLAFVMELTQ